MNKVSGYLPWSIFTKISYWVSKHIRKTEYRLYYVLEYFMFRLGCFLCSSSTLEYL